MIYRIDPMRPGLALLNRLASSDVIDRFGLRQATERVVYSGAKSGFTAVGAAQRTFKRVNGGGGAKRQILPRNSGKFDLTPTEDQAMIVGLVNEFARDVLRPSADAADACSATSPEVFAQTSEFGLAQLAVPEEYGGFSQERSVITGALVAEALAEGDMGQAVACLAPASVATAISLWGTEAQQATYLPAFTGDDVATAALTLAEPTPLFDPLQPALSATREGSELVLNGVKSAVVRGSEAELFVVGIMLDDAPRLVIVESAAHGLSVAEDPSMGLRAASMSQLKLEDVRVPESALLGTTDDYLDAVRLSRVAWAALAAGTCKAVLDYVKEYAATREAFGEPISHRQSVAFMVANIAIELEGMRLVALKAASRLERGDDAAREVALARRLASDYGMKIGTDGVQLLGGHGYVKEHPVERWYRDLRAVAVMEGAVLI